MRMLLLCVLCLLLSCTAVFATPATASLTRAEREALSYPRIFGEAQAPQTILLRFNPQCGSCRDFWFEMEDLCAQLDPARVKILLLGRGYQQDGTALMQYAALLSLYRQAWARELLRDFLRVGMYFDDLPQRLEQWMAKGDRKGLDATADWQRQRSAYLQGYGEISQSIEATDERYGIKGVPNVLVNGVVLPGNKKNIRGILEALR